jgi:hypothetical protein
MKRAALILLTAAVLGSCAKPTGPLTVKQFTLRDTKFSAGDDLMVRGEIRRRLHGAISPNEQRDRLGQYYTVIWNNDTPGGPAEVVFEYQQASTASLVKRTFERFEPGTTSGTAEFQVTGENFRKNGRVLAWRVALRRDGRELAARRSYLWQDDTGSAVAEDPG